MDDTFSSDEISSDEELQDEFSKGNLKPGLIVRKAPLKTYTNNVAGMKEKIAELLEKGLEWIERMDITAPASESVLPTEEGDEEEKSGVDPEDDFKREMHFYQQAQASVLIGFRKLESLSVPTSRPEDYYAEMVKTDDHMRKVRQSLLSKQKILEHREKARKMRELKKYGKKVQHEILQKRRAEKKATLEAVKKFKKGRGERPSFLDHPADESFPVSTATEHPSQQQRQQRQGGGGAKKRPMEKSKKRELKDKKFGFGGKKRRSKSNTAESSADTSFFNAAKHSHKGARVGGGKNGRRGKKQDKRGATGGKRKGIRLGKSRRQKMKLKR